MNNRRLYLFILSLLVMTAFTPDAPAQTGKNVTIGIVRDGVLNRLDVFYDTLNNELASLLGSKYNVRVPESKNLGSNWSIEIVEKNYLRLVNDKQVDIILGLGTIASSVIATKANYPKPVMLLGIIDPQLQEIPKPVRNTSGVHNLTYVLFNRSLSRDLDTFHRVYPYKKVGIVFYNELFKLARLSGESMENVMKKNQTGFHSIPITTGIDDVLGSLANVDSVYIGFLGKFENDKADLIRALNKKGVPTFGSTVGDVKLGALAATAMEENFAKITRRIALNVEAILNGEDPSGLPVNISFKENLTINMETAKTIDFSPKFSVLSEAEVLNPFLVKSSRVLDLAGVMREALKMSPDLKINRSAVTLARKDVSLARRQWMPSVTLNATGVQIDGKRAAASMGQQAQRTLNGTASLSQLLFSEQAVGNTAIQKHRLRGVEQGFRQAELDVALEAANAFFNVLKARNLREIRKANVDLIKQNLDIAKQREAVGHSGRSDVYRWESRLASATTDLLSAQNSVRLAKFQLNQLLNHPLDETFIAKETALNDGLFAKYTTGGFRESIDNPKSFELFTGYLIERALDISPEVRQLDANIAVLNRSLASLKRKRFVPSLGLSAEAQRLVSRGGTGSDVPGVNPLKNQWSIAINASLPVFQGGTADVEIQQARIQIKQLEDQRAQLVQLIELKVRAALLEVTVSRVNLESSRKSAEFAGKSLDLVRDAYSKGTVSITELADAQNNALNADLNAMNSVYEFLLGILETERATGRFTLMSSAGQQQEFFNRFKAYLEQHSN
ncbi:MAG: TolC family protein [bacterium]|nr:TolC family protein [bacterium]